MAYCLNQVRVGYLSEERADLPVFRQCLQALLESTDANEFPCKVVKGSRVPVAFRVCLSKYAEVACGVFVVRGRASERNRCTGVSDFLRVHVFVDFSFPFQFLLEDSDHFRLSLSVLANELDGHSVLRFIEKNVSGKNLVSVYGEYPVPGSEALCVVSGGGEVVAPFV